jgi:hypothetical protein
MYLLHMYVYVHIYICMFLLCLVTARGRRNEYKKNGYTCIRPKTDNAKTENKRKGVAKKNMAYTSYFFCIQINYP